MSGVDIVSYLTQALYVVVAMIVVRHTLKRPSANNIYVLVFFLLLMLVIAFSWVQRVVDIAPTPISDWLPTMLIMSLPYVLLRLAQAYSSVPRVPMRLAEIGLLATYALIIGSFLPQELFVLILVTYFAIITIYAAYRFRVGSRTANGITRRRLQALYYASVLLGVGLFSVAFTSIVDGLLEELVIVARQLMLAGSAILYLIGFAPPLTIRRMWQEPLIRDFLGQTLRLSHWSSTDDVINQIERVTASIVGAPNAVLGLWDEESGLIEFHHNKVRPGQTIGGRSFEEQRPIISLDTIADDPESRELYERGQAFAVMAAPITAESGRIGVISVYSPNAPIFAHDDLTLLSLVADQLGVILENRKHLQVQAELAAQQEATRLKDEFLSVAAHDLKTPLTTIIASGQLLERRLGRMDETSPEYRAVIRLNRESRRLRSLVQGLLDSSRIERGQLVTHFEETDLSELVREVADRAAGYGTHEIVSVIEPGLTGMFDGLRIQQVVENLLENAQKYSPLQSRIEIRAWQEDQAIRLSVRDQGPGIPPDEQKAIFDRYYRSPSTGNGTTPGIGLGLYICMEIVHHHEGSIWVESTPGEGSTFHVSLDLSGQLRRRDDAVNTGSR